MDKDVLRGLGLTNNEVEIYLALLKSSSISVNELAQKSGLHRQAIYDALERLLEKGFASYVVENNKKFFQAIDPEKILEYIKEKENKFKSVLPELLKLAKLRDEETTVEVFKGKKIVRTVYREVIRESQERPGEILILGGSEKKFIEEDKLALEQHLKRLQKLKCSERVLIEEGDINFMEGPQTKYRWMPKETFSPMPTYVFNDKFGIVIWGNPNYFILIENKEIAETYRKQFNLIWRLSKNVDKSKDIKSKK